MIAHGFTARQLTVIGSRRSDHRDERAHADRLSRATIATAPSVTGNPPRMSPNGRSPPAGAVVNETLHQLAQDSPAECPFDPRSASNEASADPGEMGKHLIRSVIIERKPRITFVGHAAIGFKAKPKASEADDQAMELRKFLIGPISSVQPHIGETHDTTAHTCLQGLLAVGPHLFTLNNSSLCIIRPSYVIHATGRQGVS